MQTSKYSFKYFHDSLPDWKRRKDPILSRVFYRPVSFFTASICARMGIQANTVSYLSALLAIVACVCFLFDDHTMNIVGASLINVWLIMDCTDGNLARSVKKQPFGAFADAMSSYILVGFMCVCIGVAVYFEGGFFIEKNCPWMIFIGALAGSSDSLLRLIFQKYKNVEREMADKGVVQIEEINLDAPDSLIVKVNQGLGIGGIMPLAILLCAIFNALDIFIAYSVLYFGGSFLASLLMLVRKAIRKQNLEFPK